MEATLVAAPVSTSSAQGSVAKLLSKVSSMAKLLSWDCFSKLLMRLLLEANQSAKDWSPLSL